MAEVSKQGGMVYRAKATELGQKQDNETEQALN